MRRALALAREAEQAGEVPVGAVVVRDGELIGDDRHLAHYLRQTFQREPDFRVTSVNYDFAELLVRAEVPRQESGISLAEKRDAPFGASGRRCYRRRGDEQNMGERAFSVNLFE